MMNEQSHKRKVLKLVGLALSLAILAPWLLSTRWSFAYTQYGPQPIFFAMRAGILDATSTNSNYPAQWLARTPRGWRHRSLQWMPEASIGYQLGLSLPGAQSYKGCIHVWMPLWIPFLLCAAPTFAMWYWDVRREKLSRGRVNTPWCAPQLRRILSIVSFPALFLAQGWIIDQWDPQPKSDLGAMLIPGTVLLISYVGARLIYDRLGWRWAKSATENCKSCGYNLTGNTSGTCPECGTSIQNKPSATSVIEAA